MIDPRRDVRPLSGSGWRMVEAQHRISTLKLVDTVEEQALLEELVDAAKPPRPPEPEFEGLHYLLATPFRYPPLRHGSRFGRRHQRGVFYGARAPRTAMAEVAYYRLWFVEGSAAELDHLETEHTLLRFGYRTRRGVDLLRPEFAHLHAELASTRSYATTHAVGDLLREHAVDAFRTPSARDPDGGVTVALLSPRAFTRKEPEGDTPTWVSTTTARQVVFRRRSPFVDEQVVFERAAFLVGGALPSPSG